MEHKEQKQKHYTIEEKRKHVNQFHIEKVSFNRTIKDYASKHRIPLSTFKGWLKTNDKELVKKALEHKKFIFGKQQEEKKVVEQVQQVQKTKEHLLDTQAKTIKELEVKVAQLKHENKDHRYREENIQIMIKGLDETVRSLEFAFNEILDASKKMKDIINVWSGREKL